ncbi:efflux RND transporter periplasmic adaptor subunit [bacterium]|nr:efflux RND transporter periplasmic adaptor subunit [bacterium]
MAPPAAEILQTFKIGSQNFFSNNKNRKNSLIAAGVIAALVVVAAIIHHRSHRHTESLRKFMVTSPWRSSEAITQQYVGQVRAIQHIELRALERGYLNEIFVDEGQQVKKGQQMFRIMPMINAAEYKKAEAEADLAKIEYDNTETLAKRKVVSKNELLLAKAKYEKAKASRELAKIHLDLTEIKAPFDGIMGRFNVRLGSLLEEGELLTTLSDNSKVWVYFNVSEAEYLDYRTHSKDPNQMAVGLKMANGQLFESPGKVETIEADFNNETGNIAFRATFPNEKGILRHGETGNVLVTVPLKDALVVPQKATFDILDKKFVYVVDKEHVVTPRELKIGEEIPHLYVVTSGLEEGDQILFEGLGKVKQGDKIEVDFLEPEKALARLNVPAQ